MAEPCVLCVSKVERLDLSVANELSGAPPGPKKSRTEEEGTDGDWQAILESSHHLQVSFILSLGAQSVLRIESACLEEKAPPAT